MGWGRHLRTFWITAALTCSLLPGAANAEGGSQTVAKPIKEGLLLGCLPVAMGLLDFIPENSESFASLGIELVEKLPETLPTSLQPPEWGRSSLATWKLNEGTIWFIAYPQKAVCSMAIADTEAGLDIREILRQELKAEGAPWKKDEVRSSTGAMIVDVYTWDLPDGKRMMLRMSGPNDVVNGGKGLQMLITVARVR